MPKHLNYELQTQHDRFRNMHDYWHHETLSHREGSLRLFIRLLQIALPPLFPRLHKMGTHQPNFENAVDF